MPGITDISIPCRLTGIDDNIAGNYIKIPADFISLNERLHRPTNL